MLTKVFKVLMIVDASDPQTPEQSPAGPFCPQKNGAEHFQRSCGHPKREERKKKTATSKPVYGCYGNPCLCLLTSRLRAALVPSPTFPSSCLLMFCKMLSSREASATCRSALLTYRCDSHSDNDLEGAALAEAPPLPMGWFS